MRALIACLLLTACTPVLADTLEWMLPTQTVSGDPISDAPITAVTVYKGSAPYAGLAATATSIEVPSCSAGEYTVTATNAHGESGHSNKGAVAIVPAKCVPKPPSGARFR